MSEPSDKFPVPLEETKDAIDEAIKCADSTKQLGEDSPVLVSKSLDSVHLQYSNNTKVRLLLRRRLALGAGDEDGAGYGVGARGAYRRRFRRVDG